MRNIVTAVLVFLACAAPAAGADLVYLNTPQGAERLVTAKLRDQFFAVQPYVETQQNLAFCGPASLAAVLNSLDIPRPDVGPLYPYTYFTQDNVFTAATQRIKSYIGVSSQGMTLAEIAAFGQRLGVAAERYYGDALGLEQLRSLIATALSHPDRRLIVNYSRQPLGQAGAGHL